MEENFFTQWINFIVTIVIGFGLIVIYSMFSESKLGDTIRKWVGVVVYPFYKLRSKLPLKLRGGFDLTVILLYCIGIFSIIVYFENK